MWLAPVAVATVILYTISQFNYLLFHSLAEGFAVIVAAMIYMLATRTYKHSRNNTFLFLGIAFLYIAVLDFTHMLTYKGMGVFPQYGSDTPTQLWIAGRSLEAMSFLIVIFLQQKPFNRLLVTAAYTLVTAGLLLTIMVFQVFPVCFVEGAGLTTFKVFSEYIIVVLLLAGAYRLYRGDKDKVLFKTVGLAMVITAIAELTFTLYTDVYGVANMLGHLLKIVSYYIIYTGIVAQGIDIPYSLMAAELKDRAIKDELTGLYNRLGLVELVQRELSKPVQERRALGVLMMDLDSFKLVNDRYGHACGDMVLKKFAAILGDSIRDHDLACRYGGDEFVVLVWDVDSAGLSQVQQRIEAAAEAWFAEDERLQGLGVTIGAALLQPGQLADLDSLLKTADKNMYALKQRKKICAGLD